MSDPTVLQAKRYGIYNCQPTDTLEIVAKQMITEQISTLVVTDVEGYLAGIITRTDLLHAYRKFSDWSRHTVNEMMQQTVITVFPNDHLSKVTQLLLEKNIHRVVVVQSEDDKLRPLAVISAADLVYHMVQDISDGR